MSRDISNIIKNYLEKSFNREDIDVSVIKKINRYHIHFLVYAKPEDTDNDIIRKGIDKFRVYKEIGDYFNLNHQNCLVTYNTVPYWIYVDYKQFP